VWQRGEAQQAIAVNHRLIRWDTAVDKFSCHRRLAKALYEDPVVVQAVYEKGVLKPSQPLDLAEQQVVKSA